MEQSSRDDRAVVLKNWPRPDCNVPAPRVLADDTRLSLMYFSDREGWVVIHFPLCMHLIFGEPNDEALNGHPLYRCGLQPYSVHEVENSSLVQELERRNSVHPKHDPDLWLNSTHYIFTFHDSTLECVIPNEETWGPEIQKLGSLREAETAWLASMKK